MLSKNEICLFFVENQVGKPNELKDSCSVWEEILNLQKSQIKNLLSLSNLLNNRKQTILSTIRDAEKRYKEATDKLGQA